MKPEPLKDKVVLFDESILMPNDLDRGFRLRDIKSAVEWLKEWIDEYLHNTEVKKQTKDLIQRKIDEAFEDVISPKNTDSK